MSNSELACTYAALILADDGVEITVSFFPQLCSFLSLSPSSFANSVPNSDPMPFKTNRPTRSRPS